MGASQNSPDGEQPEIKIPCEVYSRVVGYLRPVQNWHQGKQQEFRERKPFRTPEAALAEERPQRA
jgi:anaerobic ribonucleoside-triphosphate reductase